MLFPAENFIAKNGISYTLRSPELADAEKQLKASLSRIATNMKQSQ